MQILRTTFPKKTYVRTAVLIAVVAALLLFSGGKRYPARTSLEQRLESLLSCMEGAGEVRVLINEASGGSVSAWNPAAVAADKGITGVLIAAQGASDPSVCAKLSLAAGTALGVEQSRIEVVSMRK